MSEDTKQKFYKILNTIVSAERIDNEEAYIINDYVSNLEAVVKEKQQEIERLNHIISNIENDLLDRYYGREKYHLSTDVIGIQTFYRRIKELKGE